MACSNPEHFCCEVLRPLAEAALRKDATMDRRIFLATLGAMLPVGAARAHHGWEPYDLTRPLYVEGEVTVIMWSDPHPHLELLHRPDAQLPRGLNPRSLPPQKDAVDYARILASARVAPATSSRVWRVDLPTLARLTAWKVARPHIKQVIGVVGYPGPLVTGTPTLAAELLVFDDRLYPMRSDPA